MANVSSVSGAGGMFNANTNTVSSSADPYATQTYSPESNDKNTLTISSYFKLLAAEMANQDMTNPMDSSEIMNQMSQMAMVQSLASMTTALQTSTTLSQTSYAASMIGKQVTLNVADPNSISEDGTSKLLSGVISSVNLSGEKPTFYLEGDSTEYSLDSITTIGGSVLNTTGTGTAAGAAASSAGLTGKALIISELKKLNIKGTEDMSYQELTDLFENAKDGKMPRDRSLWIDDSDYDAYDWSRLGTTETKTSEKTASETSTSNVTSDSAKTQTEATATETTTAAEKTEATTEAAAESTETTDATGTIDQQAAAASESTAVTEEAAETTAENNSQAVEETAAASETTDASQGDV